MPDHEAIIDKVAESIICLRKARAGFSSVLPARDKWAYKARIDLCDHLISTVSEIDQHLRLLSSEARR